MNGGASAEHFEALHRDDTDPWATATSWYEGRKRDITVAMLPEPVAGSAFEPGCSVGALTEQLAPRCSALLASDGSHAAVETCRRRMEAVPHVVVDRRTLPAEWPAGPFDLVVVSELGYYLAPADLDLVLARAHRSLRPGGTLLAVHWRRVADDFRLPGGDAVHARIDATDGLSPTASYVDHDFRAETWTAGP